MVSKDGVVTQGEGAGEEAQGGKQVHDETPTCRARPTAPSR